MNVGKHTGEVCWFSFSQSVQRTMYNQPWPATYWSYGKCNVVLNIVHRHRIWLENALVPYRAEALVHCCVWWHGARCTMLLRLNDESVKTRKPMVKHRPFSQPMYGIVWTVVRATQRGFSNDFCYLASRYIFGVRYTFEHLNIWILVNILV